MNASDFDFVRFNEWLSEREEYLLGFFNGSGESNILLVEEKGSRYTKCRTPEESLSMQLDALTAQMDLESGHVPFLEPWFGVGVFANAYGAEYVWIEGESPQTHYIVFSEEEAARLEYPGCADSPVMKLVLDAIDYFVEQTRGQIPVSCTDTQSPIDTATLIWETSSFFTALYTAPETVHSFMNDITNLIIEFTDIQIEHLGETWSRPGHIMASARGGRGFSISDDNIVMLSPENYMEFALPYNSRLGEKYNGLAVHSCGNYARQLEALAGTGHLMMIDGAFSGVIDPNPNIEYEHFRDTLKGTDIILHCRTHLDWPDILPRIYDPDLRLVLKVPPPGEGEPADINMRKLNDILDAL